MQKSHNLTEGDHKCSSSLSSSNSNELDDINSFTNEQNPAQLIDGGPEIVQNDRINYNNSFPRLLQKKTGMKYFIECYVMYIMQKNCNEGPLRRLLQW